MWTFGGHNSVHIWVPLNILEDKVEEQSEVSNDFKAAHSSQKPIYREVKWLGKCSLPSWALGQLSSEDYSPGAGVGRDACSWVTWVTWAKLLSCLLLAKTGFEKSRDSGKFRLLQEALSISFVFLALDGVNPDYRHLLPLCCSTPYSSHIQWLESLKCSYFLMWYPLCHILLPGSHLWPPPSGPWAWFSFRAQLSHVCADTSSCLPDLKTSGSYQCWDEGHTHTGELWWKKCIIIIATMATRTYASPPPDQGTIFWSHSYPEYEANTLKPKWVWTGMVKSYKSHAMWILGGRLYKMDQSSAKALGEIFTGYK